MRFGAMNFPIKPVLEEIEDIIDMGMDFVELTMDPPMAHHSQIQMHAQAIRQLLDRHDTGLVCHLPTFVYTADLTDSIRRASLQEVLSSLETAASLGAEKIVLHPSYVGGLAVYVMDRAMAYAMKSLDIIYQQAVQLGISVCIENMFPRVSPFVEPEDFEPLFDAHPELRLVLDTGHAFIGDKSGRRILDFITRYGNRLDHLHVSDNAGKRDEHLPIGFGRINFKRVAEALKRIGYQSTITLEIFAEDRTALIQSRNKLRKLLS